MSGRKTIVAVLIVLALIVGVAYCQPSRTSPATDGPIVVAPRRGAAPPSPSPTPAAANQGTATGILGTYYFKGIGLMEVRQEGDSVVTETLSDKDAFEIITRQSAKSQGAGGKQQTLDEYSKFRHHGRLVGANRIEFDDADFNSANLVKRSGLAGALVLMGILSDSPALLQPRGLGRYYERWELLPNNALKVECAIPVFNVTLMDPGEAEKMIQFKDAFLAATKSTDPGPVFFDTYAAAHAADLTRVCGWKITQDSEREAWKALNSGDYAKAAQLFQASAQAQPGWPFPCLGEAWARIGTKEYDLARKALQTGRERLTDETRPWLTKFVLFLRGQIDSYETAAAGAGVDFQPVLEAIGAAKPGFDLPGLPDLLKKPIKEWNAGDYDLANQAVRAFPCWDSVDSALGKRGRSPLVPISQTALTASNMAATKLPDFQSLQSTAKTIVLRGKMWQTRREYSNAVAQYALAVRLGQLARHGTLIAHLVGGAMEQIGLNAMAHLFEDGLPDDPQTLQAMSLTVDSLVHNEPQLEPGELFAFEFPLVPFCSDPLIELPLEAIALPNYPDAQMRTQMVGARLELVRAACAVKAKSLKPPFPPTMDATALPEDVFAPGQPLHYRAAGNEAVLYSVGPDKHDDGGTLAYDPTNGTTSAGDVVLRIR